MLISILGKLEQCDYRGHIIDTYNQFWDAQLGDIVVRKLKLTTSQVEILCMWNQDSTQHMQRDDFDIVHGMVGYFWKMSIPPTWKL
jgi:hypothetical protein